MRYLLLLSVFVVATCGLVYELVAGTLASYLLGDSVTQFSTVIGTYLFSMGIGSFLSRYVKRNLISLFIRVEILIGLIGGFSGAILFMVFGWADSFRLILYGLVSLTGILVGLEIPLLMRAMEGEFEFKDLISRVFTFDYIGALAASLLFPLLLVPHLGLIRTSLMFGMFNVAVALLAIEVFRDSLPTRNFLRITVALVLGVQVAGFIAAERIQKMSESAMYPGTIIHATSSPYQRVIMTRQKDDFRLYLNGHLQFSSRDEYRYHESLVHPVMEAVPHAKNILVLGGGDGMAVREILRYPHIESITLVDLDPTVTKLFSTRGDFRKLNGDAFHSEKVNVKNEDAFQWIRNNPRNFDVIIIDLPDPTGYSLGKLYTEKFYSDLYPLLSPEGFAVVQSTSPLVAPNSFWCVEKTLATAGYLTFPYHCYVPSFGEWGFIIFGKQTFLPPGKFVEGLRYLDKNTFAQMYQFPPDMAKREVEANRLDNQSLVHYFESEWSKYEEY